VFVEAEDGPAPFLSRSIGWRRFFFIVAQRSIMKSMVSAYSAGESGEEIMRR
jgi:hypothetical protein